MTPINPIDREELRARVRSAEPFPNFCIDRFLDEKFAERVLDAFPTYEQALAVGRSFAAVNERGKVQVTDASKFAGPVAELNRALSAPEFLDSLSYVFDIPHILPDEELVGGGIHQTGPRGHLDVHVDFNYIRERDLHRRLNILIYFNKGWKSEWGGNIELWDREVKTCYHSFAPIFNRCVVFETSEVSYHGVTAVNCPVGRSRKSFAAYYYTKGAPAHWTGEEHTTIFRARPNEVLKGKVFMPLEGAQRRLQRAILYVKQRVRG
jgi:Rps23 Pro-64 3,4-dihydroxylase Tpa1-like proline 4-hydroxylase